MSIVLLVSVGRRIRLNTFVGDHNNLIIETQWWFNTFDGGEFLMVMTFQCWRIFDAWFFFPIRDTIAVDRGLKFCIFERI